VNRSAKLARLRLIYDDLPTIECKGLCSDACHHIAMTNLEHEHIESTHGTDIQMTDSPCPALDFMGRCSVYSDRPLICRLWGLVEGMECHYGCRPSKLLTREEGFSFLARANELSGPHYVS
jgi:uncharacterized protein